MATKYTEPIGNNRSVTWTRPGPIWSVAERKGLMLWIEAEWRKMFLNTPATKKLRKEGEEIIQTEDGPTISYIWSVN